MHESSRPLTSKFPSQTKKKKDLYYIKIGEINEGGRSPTNSISQPFK